MYLLSGADRGRGTRRRRVIVRQGGLLQSNVRFGLMADIQFKFNNGKVGGQQSFGALLANGNCAGQSGHP